MADDLTFSERQAIIFCIETFMDHADEWFAKPHVPLPPYVYRGMLQSCLDKLGGNVELNRKLYLEERQNIKNE